MFYNTTSEIGSSLKECIRKADKQSERIKLLFKEVKGKMTPYEVKRLYENFTDQPILITSVRRTLSDLTDEGFLTKLDQMRKSPYNRNEHFWIIADGHIEINQS